MGTMGIVHLLGIHLAILSSQYISAAIGTSLLMRMLVPKYLEQEHTLGNWIRQDSN